MLAERDGLTSWWLFFLDRLGPVADRAAVVDLRVGLTGDGSREGLGEFAADAARLVCNFFVAGREEVVESRTVAFEDMETGWSLPTVEVLAGSADSWVTLEMGVFLSSIVAIFFGRRRGRCLCEL